MAATIYQPVQGEFYVYVLSDPSKVSEQFPNGTPFYVGKGQGDRAFRHLSAGDWIEKDNPHKHRIIQSLKRQSIQPRINCAWYGSDESIALRVEMLLIAALGQKANGGVLTNLTPGGDRPPAPKGRTPWMKGRRHSDESLAKLSQALKGKPSGMRGKKHTEESKRKMSEARKGKATWMKGKKHTPEANAKNREAHLKRKARPELDAQVTEPSIDSVSPSSW